MKAGFYGKSMYDFSRHFGIERKSVELPEHVKTERDAYHWLKRNGYTSIQAHDFELT